MTTERLLSLSHFLLPIYIPQWTSFPQWKYMLPTLVGEDQSGKSNTDSAENALTICYTYVAHVAKVECLGETGPTF